MSDPLNPPLRYLVFTGADYYPNGGWYDLHSRYATEIEALMTVHGFSGRGWWHIIDLETDKELYSEGDNVTEILWQLMGYEQS